MNGGLYTWNLPTRNWTPFLLPIFGPLAHASTAPPPARMYHGYIRPRTRHSPHLDFPSDAHYSLAHLTDTGAVATGGIFDEALPLRPRFAAITLDVHRREQLCSMRIKPRASTSGRRSPRRQWNRW